MEAGARHEKAGTMVIGRFGTTVTMIEGKWMPVPSLPDFDCVLRGGIQTIIEAKAVTASRLLDFQKSKLKPKQVSYMLKRARMGALCFLAIHFSERVLKTSQTPAVTVLVPVLPSDPRWEDFVKTKHGEGLSPEAALAMGTEIEWTAPGRASKELPDIRDAVMRLSHLFHNELLTTHD